MPSMIEGPWNATFITGISLPMMDVVLSTLTAAGRNTGDEAQVHITDEEDIVPVHIVKGDVAVQAHTMRIKPTVESIEDTVRAQAMQ